MGDHPFNNPFRDAHPQLKRQLRQWQQEARRVVRDPRRAEPVAGASPTGHAAAGEADVEQQAFQRAMAGVAPLAPDQRVGSARQQPAPRLQDEDAEAYAQLADLVAGNGPFDIADTAEFVGGIARGVDRRLLKRLRRGDFAVQGDLDLHRLTREEARPAVERFLSESRLARRRCILIIHGRGRNSKDQEPVLKPALVSWLSRGGLARQVLAFSTARPVDGGAGALYVLLRK